MKYPNCPNCWTPMNGRTCKECGTNPHKEETEKCDGCGRWALKEDCEVFYTEDPLTARRKEQYVCSDCQ